MMMHRENNGQRTMKGTVCLFLIVLLTSLVSGVEITSISVPTSVSEGELLEASFLAESNETISYSIFVDGSLVSSDNTFSWQTDYADAGVYEFLFSVESAGESVNETRTITIENVSLQLDIISPSELYYNIYSTEIIAESEQADSCSYEIVGEETGTLTKDGSEYSKTIILTQGNFELIVTCQNSEESKSETFEFEIDTTAPQITSSSPSNPYTNPIQGTTATMQVQTNEQARCRFDTADISYGVMDDDFANTGATNHYHDLIGLGQGAYTYYVRCEDNAGNTMLSSETITFYTNKKPTAEVDITGDSPFREGRYDITLTANENLQSAPILQYNFHNDAGKRTISLTGSGKTWTGYLIIEDSTSDKVGTFYFSGIDESGLTGTEITSGKLFLVDTDAPPAVDSLNVEQDGDELRLEWHYDDEEVKRFNIYRSTESGVSYTDYHSSTSSKIFEDSEVEFGVTYYYKVAAKDGAGNEGPLSDQVFGKVEPELSVAEPLSPTLSVKVDQRIKSVESSLLDVDWVIRALEDETDPEKIEAIDKLSLLSKTKAVRGNLNSLKSNLESLKNLDLDGDELDKRLDKTDLSYKTQTTQLIKSVDVIDKLEYQQSFDEGLFRENLNEYALYKELENDDALVKLNAELQEKITVVSKILIVKVDYLDGGETDDYTIITKAVTTSEPLSSVSVVETIPKLVEDNAEDIIFSESPNIIKKDPVVEWLVSGLTSKSYYYIISDIVDIGEAKKTRTNVFSKGELEQVNTEPSGNAEDNNEITGLVTGDSGGSAFSILFMILGTIVIVGLLVYYFFFLNESVETSVEAPVLVKRKLPEKAQVIVQKSFSENLGRLMLDANQKADEMDFSTVYKLYQSIIHLYSATVFASDYSREQASAEVNKVYSKLLLFNKMRTANTLMAENRLIELKIVLDDINRLLKLHESEQGLFYGRMKILHDHLSVSSIALGDSK